MKTTFSMAIVLLGTSIALACPPGDTVVNKGNKVQQGNVADLFVTGVGGKKGNVANLWVQAAGKVPTATYTVLGGDGDKDLYIANAWTGDIDTQAPRVTLTYTPSDDFRTASVRCAVEDYNLTEDGWVCPVDDAFRSPAYQDAAWFTGFFGATQKLKQLSTSEQTVIVEAGPFMTACDLAGHCVTATPDFAVLTVAAPGSPVQINTPVDVNTGA